MPDQIQTQEQVEAPVVTIINLNAVQDEVCVEDMNYKFHYKRIFNPEGELSDFFTLFYQEEGMDDWFIVRGILSKNYTVVKTEDLIARIIFDLQGDMLSEKHFRDRTVVKSTFLLRDYQLDVERDALQPRLIFKLLTGIDQESVNSRTGLAFSVINGFSGNLALVLSYGFLLNMVAGDKRISINNMFLFHDYTKRLIHGSSMYINYEEVNNIRENCSRQISKFRDVPITDDFISNIAHVSPVKFSEPFVASMDMLPVEYRDMYHVSYILSNLVEGEKNISLEMRLRKLMSDTVNAHFVRQEQANG